MVLYLGGQSSTRVAVVTGASKGLGALIARELAFSEYQVIPCSRNSHKKVDITDKGQVSAFVNYVVSEHGQIDALINNAGYAQHLTSLENTRDEDLLKCFQTNVFGPFFIMKAVIPIMVKQGGGVIVNVCSKAAIYAVPKLAAYSASKAALLSLTQTVAKELRSTNVLCVAVCPAGMNTEMRASVYGRVDAEKQQSPQRVADLVCEIIFRRTVDGKPIRQGSCVIIQKNEVTMVGMQDA